MDKSFRISGSAGIRTGSSAAVSRVLEWRRPTHQNHQLDSVEPQGTVLIEADWF